MTDIETLRHSCAHVMATAICASGRKRSSPPVRRSRMASITMWSAAPDLAGGFPADRGGDEEGDQGQPRLRARGSLKRAQALDLLESGRLGAIRKSRTPKFKLESPGHPRRRTDFLFRNGDFIDLCAGPHVMRTGNIGAFKLTHVASAYYKGDDRNPQLQRIYGTAFKNKTELDAYFTMLEEARKRDHRKIGREMELFASTRCRSGLPLWLPRGVLIEELEKLAKETEFARAISVCVRRTPPEEHVLMPRASARTTPRQCFLPWSWLDEERLAARSRNSRVDEPLRKR